MSSKRNKAKRKQNYYQANGEKGLIMKEEGQEYAQVMKLLSNGRLETVCFDGKQRLCHIRGKLKKVSIYQGDIILVSMREFQDSVADVIYKYSREELVKLKDFLLNNNNYENDVNGNDNDFLKNILDCF